MLSRVRQLRRTLLQYGHSVGATSCPNSISASIVARSAAISQLLSRISHQTPPSLRPRAKHSDWPRRLIRLWRKLAAPTQSGNKLIFVGNGGSAAIASHMATDYSKNGDIRSLALNDSSMLTCLGNDLGYDRFSPNRSSCMPAPVILSSPSAVQGARRTSLMP